MVEMMVESMVVDLVDLKVKPLAVRMVDNWVMMKVELLVGNLVQMSADKLDETKVDYWVGRLEMYWVGKTVVMVVRTAEL